MATRKRKPAPVPTTSLTPENRETLRRGGGGREEVLSAIAAGNTTPEEQQRQRMLKHMLLQSQGTVPYGAPVPTGDAPSLAPQHQQGISQIERVLSVVRARGPEALSPEDLDLYLRLVNQLGIGR